MTKQLPNIETKEGQEQLRQMGIRVIPQPDEVSAPYWEAARRHELRIQRCGSCGGVPCVTCVNAERRQRGGVTGSCSPWTDRAGASAPPAPPRR